MDKIKAIPIVTMEEIVVFPGSLIHFDVFDKNSQKAIKAAMNDDQLIFLSLPLEEQGPQKDNNYVGVVSKVKYYINLANDNIRVLVEGLSRAKLVRVIDNNHNNFDLDNYESKTLGIDDVDYAEIEIINNEGEDLLSFHEKQAMIRSLKEIFTQYTKVIGSLGQETVKRVLEIESLTELIDEITTNIPIAPSQKQDILETINITFRYEKLSKYILDEIEIIQIKRKYQIKVKEKVDTNQKEYILREQLKLINEELGEGKTDYIEEYLDKLQAIEASDDVEKSIRRKIERLQRLDYSSAESAIERKYLELLLELPWDRMSQDNTDLKHANKILEEDHYGLDKVKTRIIEFLSVRLLTKGGDSPIICLVGPPGTGKTSIAKSIARALDKEYVKVSLGGVRDESEIRGHRRTYIGALPGRIINGLNNAGVKNPVFLLDEIDKVGKDARGDVSSALLEVLDSEQNNSFVDRYVEIPVDLSEVLFICTANSIRNIQQPLLDRMEVIEVSSYTENEKFHIGKDYLYKKQLDINGLTRKQLTITDAAIRRMVRAYTREAGVRALEREFGKLMRKAAKEIVVDGSDKVSININNLEKYLGKEKYQLDTANKRNKVGIARGLAWSNVGGTTLEIEANVMSGKGKFNITGQIGNVMKESASAGLTYIRSIADQYDIKPEYFSTHDLHIHIPEGAVKKDGPSAGITLTTAMFSAITGRKVKADLAMTGEVTLRGRVLTVGGLKEKLLAAKAVNINNILVPKDNKKDIDEFDSELKEGINIKYVSNMDEVLDAALVVED